MNNQNHIVPDNKLKSFFDQDIFDKLPSIIAIKEVGETTSKFISTNNRAAQVFGFYNKTELIGKTDIELPCQSLKNSSAIHSHDQIALMQDYPIKTIDIYKNSSENTIGVIGEKTKFSIPELSGNFIIFCGQNFTKDLFAKLTKKLLLDENNALLGKNLPFTLGFTDKYAQLGLTTRESECYYYLLRGKSSKQTGKLLGIGKKTVESYIEKIKCKSNVHTKSELFDLAYRLNIINIAPISIIANQSTTTIEEA